MKRRAHNGKGSKILIISMGFVAFINTLGSFRLQSGFVLLLKLLGNSLGLIYIFKGA